MRVPVAMPRSLPDAVALLAYEPEATVLAGGTALMVAVNAGQLRPRSFLVVAKVDELRDWRRHDDVLALGAAMTIAELTRGTLPDHAPALAQAAHMVGPRQIQNAATLGGNLGAGGDLLTALLALDAAIELASAAGQRTVPIGDMVAADGRLVQPGEIIASVWVPIVRGRQEYLKVGAAGLGLALVADDRAQAVRCAVASYGVPPLRAHLAEHWVGTRIDWWTNRLASPDVPAEFGERVAELVPYGGSDWELASYRRRAVMVCARRALERVVA